MAAHARVLELRRALYAVLAAAAQCTAPFVLVLDTTIVTVALPLIGRELGFSPATLHWVLASYALVLAVCCYLVGAWATCSGIGGRSWPAADCSRPPRWSEAWPPPPGCY